MGGISYDCNEPALLSATRSLGLCPVCCGPGSAAPGSTPVGAQLYMVAADLSGTLAAIRTIGFERWLRVLAARGTALLKS